MECMASTVNTAVGVTQALMPTTVTESLASVSNATIEAQTVRKNNHDKIIPLFFKINMRISEEQSPCVFA